MYEILINVLVFSAILLLLALTIGVVIGVMILVDIRRSTKEVTRKIKAVTSALDIISMVVGGFGGARKTFKKKLKTANDSNVIAFIAGIKRALTVFLRK